MLPELPLRFPAPPVFLFGVHLARHMRHSSRQGHEDITTDFPEGRRQGAP